MVSLNKVFLIGNLTKDPELRYTPQGVAVTTLRLAVNRNFKDKNGERRQETCFINIIAWGNLAEICNQYLQKGRPIFVEGSLQSRSWQDSEGKTRSTIEVRADSIQFLSSKIQAEEIDLGPEPKLEEIEEFAKKIEDNYGQEEEDASQI